jgi:hypothetical protein
MDVANAFSTASTVGDCVAMGIDAFAVGTSAIVTGTATAVAGPGVGAMALGAIESVLSPALFIGNVLAAGATLFSGYSDAISGKSDLTLDISSSSDGFSISANSTLGGATKVGLVTTGLGFAVPTSYASALVQGYAVLNDFGVDLWGNDPINNSVDWSSYPEYWIPPSQDDPHE